MSFQSLGELWRFDTARFSVVLDYEYEQEPDFSFDEETRKQYENGEVGCYCMRARVLVDGREIASDYLGNCIYSDPRDFVREHRDPDPMCRNCSIMRAAEGENVCICTYFTGMVSTVVSAARKMLADAPKVHAAR